jgi:hypothetical protein
VSGSAKKPRAMKEQSQLDAMRAAVRGDFERRGLTLQPPVAEPEPGPDEPAEVQRPLEPEPAPVVAEPIAELHASAPAPAEPADEPLDTPDEPRAVLEELEPEPTIEAVPRRRLLRSLFRRR